MWFYELFYTNLHFIQSTNFLWATTPFKDLLMKWVKILEASYEIIYKQPKALYNWTSQLYLVMSTIIGVWFYYGLRNSWWTALCKNFENRHLRWRFETLFNWKCDSFIKYDISASFSRSCLGALVDSEAI